MEMTWAEQMVAEYREKVLAEGLEKGVEQGVRNTLLRQIWRRFGAVPPAVRERVEAIDSQEELNGLADRILEAKSIEELGLGREPLRVREESRRDRAGRHEE